MNGADAVEAARGTVWALAALASLLAGSDDDLDAGLATDPRRRDVLRAAGYVDGLGRARQDLRRHFDDPSRERIARGLASLLGQAARAASGTVVSWADQSDDVVVAQGEASAAAGRVIASSIVPRYPEVAEALAAGGSVLDVGTGIGALATALADALPGARVVGIDVAERVLEIARARTATLPAGLAARLEFRRLDVGEVADHGVHTVGWIPVPFLPEPILTAALPRVLAALRPGGLLVAATTPPSADRVAAAAARWSTALAGGTGEGPDEVLARFDALGVRDVTTTPSFLGGPVLVAGLAPGGLIGGDE